MRPVALLMLVCACAARRPPPIAARPPTPTPLPPSSLAFEAAPPDPAPSFPSPPPATSSIAAAPAGTRARPSLSPLHAFGRNVVDAFTGTNALLHVGAIGATAALSLSSADHEVHARFSRSLDSRLWSDASNIGGYVLPALTGPTIWLVGLATDDRRLAGAGAATLQALGIAMATTGIAKVATGRPYPARDEATDGPDHARDWDPFGSLGAWPSGHTVATISTAAALTAYYPDQRWIPVVGYPLALGIGLGMVERDAHWASDVLAGALIGHAIGYTVGRNFRADFEGTSRGARIVQVAPLPGAAGVSLAGAW